MLLSQVCAEASLFSPELQPWSERLRPVWDPGGVDPRPVMVHRKMWEWLFICAVLDEHAMLGPGRRGLGFGVGREPLVALFAGLGCSLVATDLDPDAARARGWTAAGGEYAGGLSRLNDHALCAAGEFHRRAVFRPVDMTQIPDDLRAFDFTWSSCAMEHLGSLDAGVDFVVEQMRCLRPGGVAVHTTELNVSSDERTIEDGPTVLYRRRDVGALVARLRAAGYSVDVDLTEGDAPADRHVDLPPYSETHLRTALGEFATTSFALIVRKPEGWRPPRRRWRSVLTRSAHPMSG
jgi:SAM-dependent methyltransferase